MKNPSLVLIVAIVAIVAIFVMVQDTPSPLPTTDLAGQAFKTTRETTTEPTDPIAQAFTNQGVFDRKLTKQFFSQEPEDTR